MSGVLNVVQNRFRDPLTTKTLSIANDFTEIRKIQASDRPSWPAQFGSSIAASNNHVIVGAFQDPLWTAPGAAYLFDIHGFQQLAKLVPNDSANQDYLSGNNNNGVAITSTRAIAGTYNKNSKGAVYLFDFSGNQLLKLQPSDLANYDMFGWSVAATENIIVAGASQHTVTALNEGAVYMFDIEGNQIRKITANDPQIQRYLGETVVVSDTRIVVGCPRDDTIATNAGAVYIFDINGNQLAKIHASDAQKGDHFGRSVAVSDTRIVVGTYWEQYDTENDHSDLKGAAYIYDIDGNLIKRLQPADLPDSTYGDPDDYTTIHTYARFGHRVAASNTEIAVSSYWSGLPAYVFDNNGNQLAKIISSEDQYSSNFGWGLCLTDTHVLIGAPQQATAGSVYYFNKFNNDYDSIPWEKIRLKYTGDVE